MQEWNGDFELVDVEEIHFDRKYQRDQNWALISMIAADPIWEAFGVVLCAKREYAGGLLYALDGQQRLTGVMTAEHPPKRVPVIWFAVKTVAEEAALFDRINTARKQVPALQIFKTRVTAENQTYIRIESAAEHAGFSVGPRGIVAVKALQTIYNAAGEEGVFVGLTSYAAAWPDEGAPSAVILMGLADVLADMAANSGLDAAMLTKALGRTTPGRILRKAEQLAFDQGISKRVAVRKAFKALAKV